VEALRSRGIVVLEPASGRLTGVDTGKGRLPEPEEIFAAALNALAARPHDLAGRHVVVSAGGTREFLDPVRFLGNRSSGKQGYALARTAVQRGARVTLVSAHTAALPEPAGAEIVNAGTAAELRDAVHKWAADADVVVMAAAVADFRPTHRAEFKIKKTDADPDAVALTRNADVLAELVENRRREPGSDQVIVGFAAETGDNGSDVLDHARAKLARKGCDLLVVNRVGEGKAFETEDNEGWLLSADGTERSIAFGSKAQVASEVWDAVVSTIRRSRRDTPPG
ncbi:bifunctional phosphopantothenoylcysteine decarboxylase/phosphopantothenate--cysteine ligase CoaBC, partial [Actinokineospora sp.]|uniref:bifunctional phosphopantothenoylcysteine decarboxylase/phosphopantothenate--cysteine ligase CoaBC n=1 Tax=Actinokineospora sp. TaxID=1872133 RepID=UPI003D6A7443